MIVITIELKSAIHESRNRLLGRVLVSNTGEKDGAKHDYDVRFINRNGRVFRKFRLKDWPRNSRSIWKLLKEIVNRGIT